MDSSARNVVLDVFHRHVDDARITVREDSREPVTVGRGGSEARDVVLRVRDPRFYRRLLTQGNLGMGEAYMDEQIEVEVGGLEELLEILLRNRIDRRIRLSPAATGKVLWMRLVDSFRGKARNVQRHYDLGLDLFESFLDSTLTYSCGYALDPDDDLETLQRNKLERICRKLQLREGERLLDVGCGFGGLVRHAAVHYGVHAVGVTNSRAHAEHAERFAAADGLEDRVQILYGDYTTVEGTFDKVVSVGMMEHVPRREYDRYVGALARVLAPAGWGLIHCVGANAARNEHDPFIQKYVFPHSSQPRLSEITRQLERHGLAIFDVENLIRHYGYTARGWLERFRARGPELPAERYGPRFVRMWEYYLSCAAAAAMASDAALYQVLFLEDYAAPLPLHRA